MPLTPVLAATLGLLLLVARPAAAGEGRASVPDVAGVEACGTDGLRLPGSDGCLRLGGQVRTETTLRLGGSAAGHGGLYRSRAQGRLAADMRVPTELGPLRLYGSLRGWRGN